MEERPHITEYFKVIDPFGDYQEGDEVALSLYDHYLELTGRGDPIRIDYDDITGAVHGTADQLRRSGRRLAWGGVIGDAVGSIFGVQDLGSLIGAGVGFASSGLHKDEYHKRLLITYKDEEGNDALVHLLDEKNKYGKEIAKELSEYGRIRVDKRHEDF